MSHSQYIPASENTTRDHYMFRNLKSNQNYTVSVTMRNGVGEGPPAIIYISTTPEPIGTLLGKRVICSAFMICSAMHIF